MFSEGKVKVIILKYDNISKFFDSFVSKSVITS